MKKLMALFMALALLLCTAFAEGTTPVPPPTQAELAQGFLLTLLQFAFGTELEGKALNLDVTENGQPLMKALWQKAQEITDLDLDFNGTPAHIQVTGDALLMALGDQVYRLSYENLEALLASGESDGIALTPALVQALFSIFQEKVLSQAITFEEHDGQQHIRIHLTGEQLVGFGDAVTGNDQIRAMLDSAKVDQVWPLLRGMLTDGKLPVSVEGEIVLGDAVHGDLHSTLSDLSCDMSFGWDGIVNEFSFSANDVLSMTGRTDTDTGAQEWHASAGNVASDYVFTPDDEGWTAQYSYTGGEDHAEISVTRTMEALEGTLECVLSGQHMDGTFNFNDETAEVKGNLSLPDGSLMELKGAPTDNGYRATLVVSQAEQVLTEITGAYIEEDGLLTGTLTMDGDGEQILTASGTYDSDSGAFDFHADILDGTYVEGSGLYTEEEKSCDITAGRSDTPIARYTFRHIDNDEIFEQSAATYEDPEQTGTWNRGYEYNAVMDKSTGAFHGHLTMPQERNLVEVQGMLTDFTFKLWADGTGAFNGHLEATCMENGDGITASACYSGAEGAFTSELLWTEGMRSFAVTADQAQFRAAVTRDDDGLARSIRLECSAPQWGIPPFELYMERQEFFARVYDQTFNITGRFLDQKTYVFQTICNEGMAAESRFTVTVTAGEDTLTFDIVDGVNNKTYRAVLSQAERTEFKALEGTVEITPEMMMQLLEEAAAPQPEPPAPQPEVPAQKAA